MTLLGLCWLLTALEPAVAAPLTLARDGVALIPILSGSLEAPVGRLGEFLTRVSGAEWEISAAAAGRDGIYVGLRSDFPWALFADVGNLGPEGFVIRATDRQLYLVGDRPAGVEQAVTSFQRLLGHRQFFPGSTWEVMPELPTIEGAWHTEQRPAYYSQRRLWYGFGAHGPARTDLDVWNRVNRMGGPEPISIGHTWYGISQSDEAFEANPEWFALVERDGAMERRRSKPCYSHPEVIAQMVQYGLNAARGGARSVTFSPPDGLGYCECDLCRAVFQGGEPERAHGTIFATRPDGLQVNIVSETLFAAVNRVAQAMADEFPEVMLGCYAYSAYSHPTSFDLHPNIYIQTTTSYRRTPLSLAEQLEQWGQRARQVGIREYWSVYQWDWDNPDPGKMRPDRLAQDLRFFRDNNVVAMNAEASNNWGPRGLGYYVAAQLLWDIDTDIPALLEDFYHLAFGPAAPAMERYFARWYGSSVVVGLDPRSPRIAAREPETAEALAEADELTDAAPVYSNRDLEGSRRTLAAAMADLDEAVALTAAHPEARARVDHLRLYVLYLYLRQQLWQAIETGEEAAIVAAVGAETRFGGRLSHTHMIHTRPLLGKAFHRRFRGQMALLENVPEAQEGPQGWRVIGPIPSAAEIDERWSEARAALGE